MRISTHNISIKNQEFKMKKVLPDRFGHANDSDLHRNFQVNLGSLLKPCIEINK
jgi:hypothetical protein